MFRHARVIVIGVSSDHLRIEMQIFSLHWIMQNIRLFDVCEARTASRGH